jgi:hypothetical protein
VQHHPALAVAGRLQARHACHIDDSRAMDTHKARRKTPFSFPRATNTL